MDYFRIKYVDDGTYFLIKSDNPPVPPVPSVSIFNVIDLITGDNTAYITPLNIAYITKGGTMFESNREIVDIQILGLNVMDKTPDSI